MKLKWKVAEVPSGPYRSFQKRGWPSAAKPFPWSHWSDLKAEKSAGGHDGECEGLGRVVGITITRGKAGAEFRMWNIFTTADNPAKWIAVEFRGKYAEPFWVWSGSELWTNRVIVQESRAYDRARDTDACAMLGGK